MTTLANINFPQQHHLVRKGKMEGCLGINQSIRLIDGPGRFYPVSLCLSPSFLRKPLKPIFPNKSYWSHSKKEEISSTASRALDPSYGTGEVYDINDLSWQASTWSQRIWLATSCITLVITLAKCISLTLIQGPWLQLLFVSLTGYLFADLTTGIYHWAIDNYGSSETPVFGSHIAGFSRHHDYPWVFAKLHLARNLDVLSTGVTLAVMPVNVFSGNPVLLGFVFVYSGCVMFSQLFHAWAHTSKGKLPVAVLALQNAGVLLASSAHATHHRPPHNNNYCMVSGIWNKFLDRSRFFHALEVVIFNVLKVKPRCWSDLSSTD